MGLIRALDVQIGERDFQLPFPVSGFTPPGGFPANQPVVLAIVNTVSSDPGVNQDISAGYTIGAVVFNSTAGALRLWTCRDNTLGAAKWVFDGADYANGGSNPVTDVTQFGLGTSLMGAEGNVLRQISSAGVNPGATGADNVIAAFTIPANSFDAAGRGLSFLAQGSFAATANTKQVKIIFNPATAVVGSTVGGGGTTVADSGAVATNNLGWSLQANVFKYGAANANTQIGLHQQAQIGNAVANLLKPSLITAVENAAILVAVTGNATTATTDIVFNFLEVNAMN